ncbi:MAG: type II CRISPR RNA-guided endonuclease Cas9 [Verrucomicrobiota bacterium]
MALTVSYDIGHASIGWCVLSAPKSQENPEILGTGVVTFPTDDCLASNRRGLRRTRRHIRSTRQRMERMKAWLAHRGVLSREDLDLPGHPAPFLLAAAALQGLRTLSAWELWTVLRWYAHNRGYDGNERWSNGGDSAEDGESDDTEKVETAKSLMKQHGTNTMAETVCACLDLNPKEHLKRISSFLPYKTLNAAYPRNTVACEVALLLQKHESRIPGLDSETIRLLMQSDPLSAEDRSALKRANIKLPLRYCGGILFGQLVPRFDNRIITRCPITWATLYDREIQSGQPEEAARHIAERDSKVPTVKSEEFLQYRFARLLANIKANGEPLPAALRRKLFALAREKGRLKHGDLDKAIKAALGKDTATNLHAYFKIHPDSENALVLDPGVAFSQSHEPVATVWDFLPREIQDAALFAWKRGNGIALADWLKNDSIPDAAKAKLDAVFEKDHAKAAKRKKKGVLSMDAYLSQIRKPSDLTGRAPYARPVLRQVVEEVLDGFDPNKPALSKAHPEGELKETDGVLYPLLDPSSRVRQIQDSRPLDSLTNNHLVRHRLLILERLTDAIIKEFCDGKVEQVERCVVEVARELKEYSGMTAKDITGDLNSKLRHFKEAVKHLQTHVPNLTLSGSLIRKCRIALDLNWQCPFTGEKYDASDLPKMEREHIIPYATRASNALHALVLTWPEVNKMKGKRTARQFITDEQSNQVFGKPNLSLLTLKNYDAFVDKLDTKGHLDDYRRKKARKALLATLSFDDHEQDFTPGQLTQSSHLMKLALRGLATKFPHAKTDPVPGIVNAEIRKAWNLIGTMALACPEIIDAETGKPRPKDEIRGITHLHHALDAATLALTAHYFPLQFRGTDRKGLIWEALLKRNKSPEDWNLLRTLKIIQKDSEGRMRITAPPAAVKEQLSGKLAECRVMQHVPADRKGTKAELTTWGVVAIIGDEALTIQRTNRGSLELDKAADSQGALCRKWVDNAPSKEATRLLKEHGNLLTARDRNLVQRGVCKLTTEKLTKLLGPRPVLDNGKLKAIGGALVIGENYGLALDPLPAIIPFHAVHKTLEALREKNHGKPVRVLRNGMLIRISNQGARNGIWRINSIKASLTIDLSRASVCGQPSKGTNAWREVGVRGLLTKGVEILPINYTGYSEC